MEVQTPNPTTQKKPRLSKRFWISLSIVLVAYIGSYIALSRIQNYIPWRRSDGRCNYLGPGFYYTPQRMVVSYENHALYWKIEQVLRVFYWPAHAIDRAVFDGPPLRREPQWQ